MSRREPERGDGRRSEWEAYADYQSVSERVAESIADAIDALVIIERTKVIGDSMKPGPETNLQADVLSAVVRLSTELENERESKQLYDEILTRWEGEEGFINRFRNVNVQNYEPKPFLQQFAKDIHRAGWELGYLKAGREKQIGESGDGHDGELRDMIEGMGE
jgi:hypothetical protein